MSFNKAQTRRQGKKVEAVNPNDGSTYTLEVNYGKIQYLGKSNNPIPLYEAGGIMPEVLMHPRHIWEGLREEGDHPKGDRGLGWRVTVVCPIKPIIVMEAKDFRGPVVYLLYL